MLCAGCPIFILYRAILVTSAVRSVYSKGRAIFMHSNTKNNHQTGRYCAAAFSAAALTAVDLITKAAAQKYLAQNKAVLIPGALELNYIKNTGAAFGILQHHSWLFIAVSVILIGVLGAACLRCPPGRSFRLLRVSVILIIGGAAGNLIDRLVFGYVRDFIYVSLIDFPVFNFADICVTTGAALLILFILFSGKEESTAFFGRES